MSPLLNECRSREKASAWSPVRWLGPAANSAPENESFIGVGMSMSMPPISSTICTKFGKFTRITYEIGAPVTEDTASAIARRSLSGRFTM